MLCVCIVRVSVRNHLCTVPADDVWDRLAKTEFSEMQNVTNGATLPPMELSEEGMFAVKILILVVDNIVCCISLKTESAVQGNIALSCNSLQKRVYYVSAYSDDEE